MLVHPYVNLLVKDGETASMFLPKYVLKTAGLVIFIKPLVPKGLSAVIMIPLLLSMGDSNNLNINDFTTIIIDFEIMGCIRYCEYNRG